MKARKPRKQQQYRFSGPPTTDPRALARSLSGALLNGPLSVRMSRGGFLVYAVNRDDDVLADATEKYVSVSRREGEGPNVTDPQAVAELVEALAVTELANFICMCAGDIALEFFDQNGTLVDVVRIDFPGAIEWPHWLGQARLADPMRLHQWMQTHWPTYTLRPVADK